MTKIRKEKAELSSAAKNKKLSTPPPRPQLSFPRKRGSIHLHTPEAAFGNTLTATDNDESEASSNTDNEVPKPSHGARYPMGPRVREDDSVRELIRTNSNTDNEVRKTSHGTRYTMGPRVREDDKNKKRKSRAKFSGKEQKTQHTAATPPTVIPAQTGIHSSTRARSSVWKCTRRDRQRRKLSQQQHRQ
ncbi:hypothetical protein [Vibrio vulnificus]|uniref:hypothetical protein n=1 Tax=Vibrio vulnificus TaxID=672 RepID=UPI001CDC0D1C|nr:hypothetical protein [Vibrio vulnificus]EJU9788196.1 hypothetical protein [Vibrio vulnificus]MCA3992988.1 hypothetical protein [Vibrio vulnificus]HDY7978126.1 hypothetical protein [Vibrio vulnificus]